MAPELVVPLFTDGLGGGGGPEGGGGGAETFPPPVITRQPKGSTVHITAGHTHLSLPLQA